MEIALIIVSVAFVATLIKFYRFYKISDKIINSKQIDKDLVEKCKKFLKKQNEIYIGRTCLLYRYPVNHGKIKFKCDFQVEVAELTENMAKVKCIDFWTDYDWANRNKQKLKDFISGQWIEIKYLKPIVDNRQIRQDKLNKLLYGDPIEDE